MINRVLFLVLLCTSTVARGQTKETPYVILVSFDGFRHDYVERFNLPNFKAFIKKGASAEGLIPSFPSKTFPNHYSIVTGMYPGHHGLVDNEFYDPKLNKRYGMRIREAVVDSNFYGGVPLWQLCRQQGVRSASFFWVGSELTAEHLHPDYYYKYDESVNNKKRTEQVIQWLKLPEKERPHFITLYFSSPDHESHDHGPLAEETKAKVLELDSLLGDFMNDLEMVKLPLNIILVSDHGMKELQHNENTFLYVREIFPVRSESLKIVNGGSQVHLYTRDTIQRDSLYEILQLKAKNFHVLKQEEFPDRWHYKTERAGDMLLIAEPGYYFTNASREQIIKESAVKKTFGVHGYDPAKVRDMQGIFYAQGTNIKEGGKIPAFENIHVYPLIAKLLNLTPPNIDGKFEILKSVYKK